MKPLNVLICGSDEPALQRMAKTLANDGICVETSSQPFNCFSPDHCWDCLLIDLDGLNSFLRNLLPSLCSSFPELPVIGISTRSNGGNFGHLTNDLRLDACLNRVPRAEDLIVCAPRVASRYLCDTKPLG